MAACASIFRSGQPEWRHAVQGFSECNPLDRGLPRPSPDLETQQYIDNTLYTFNWLRTGSG